MSRQLVDVLALAIAGNAALIVLGLVLLVFADRIQVLTHKGAWLTWPLNKVPSLSRFSHWLIQNPTYSLSFRILGVGLVLVGTKGCIQALRS